jgi:hypothetical protein
MRMNTLTSNTISVSGYGRIAGILYLVIISCGLFTEFVVRSGLIIPGDANQTALNIMANETLFRIGFVSDLIMLLSDFTIAIVFYILLKPISQTLALAAVLARLAMDATLAINLLNHFYAVLLLGGAGYLDVFSPEQLHALVSLFLQAHGVGYSIGLVFFAVHCLILGYLFSRSDLFPKIFSPMLTAAAASYLADSFARFLIAGYNSADYPLIMLPALIAEVSLCFWLLLKGARPQQQLHQLNQA